MKNVVNPLIAISLTLTMMISAVAISIDSSADELEDLFEFENFWFEPLDDSTVSLLGYVGDVSDIVIPAVATSPNTSRNYNVVEISGSFGEGITSISIPGSVQDIFVFAFTYAIDLESFSVAPSSYYEADLDGVLYTAGQHKLFQYPIGKADSTYVVSDYTSEICSYAFSGSSLTAVTLPETLLKIGEGAFCKCENLTSITFPSQLSVIENEAFYLCTSLANVVFPDDLDMIGSYAFYDTAITEINITYGIEYIGENAFSMCDDLELFTTDNYRFPVTDGILYESTGKNPTIICYPAGKTDTEFVVPENSDIKFGAFSGCKNLKSVSFPKGYNSVPEGAFYECFSLESIDLTNITYVEMYAFSSCTNLVNINNYQNLIFIGMLAFDKCGFTEFHISSKVLTVDSQAFSSCTSLEKVIIDEYCTATIESYAFMGDVNIKNIYVNSSDVIFSENSLCIGEYEDEKANVYIHVPSGYELSPDVSDEYTALHIIKEGERPYPWENWIGVFFCALIIIGILYGMREV